MEAIKRRVTGSTVLLEAWRSNRMDVEGRSLYVGSHSDFDLSKSSGATVCTGTYLEDISDIETRLT
jgi:hypothetical protein